MTDSKVDWINLKDPDEYNKAREEAYKEFFGNFWGEVIDHWMVEDRTPEDAAVILEEAGILDYCDRCHSYYFVRESNTCPYCGNSSF